MDGPAAFFDLDKTVISASSTLAFGRPLYAGGLISRGTVIRSGYAQLVFGRRGADAERMERMRRYAVSVCAGMDVARVRAVVERTLHETITPLVYPGALALIREHQDAGREVVIVSSSGAEIVEPIAAMLGVDGVIATRVEIVGGRYTSTIERYAYGPGKASAIRTWAADRGYDLDASFAYSDSITDVPMLEAVGRPAVVNPDRALRRVARSRGWPELRFRR